MKNIDKQCLNCNKNYIGYRHNQKYCSDKCRETQWRIKHGKEKAIYLKKYSQLYRQDLTEERKVSLREYQRLWGNKRREELRSQVLEAYGAKCAKCGFNDKRALQIDHKNGGGNKEFRDKFQIGGSRNRRNFYKAVLEDRIGKYQILCANCNWIKRFENNELVVLTKEFKNKQ